MTFTYSSVTPQSDLHKLRLILGDITDAGHKYEDEDLLALLALYPPAAGQNPFLAAAAVADRNASYAANSVDKSVGPLSLSSSQAVGQWNNRANYFRMLAATNGQGLIGGDGGGASVAGPIYGYNPSHYSEVMKTEGGFSPGSARGCRHEYNDPS